MWWWAQVTFGFLCAGTTGWVASDVRRIWRDDHPPRPAHVPRHAPDAPGGAVLR